METEGGGGEGRGDSREGATEDGQEEQTRGEDRLDNKEPREPRLASSPSPPALASSFRTPKFPMGMVRGGRGEGERGRTDEDGGNLKDSEDDSRKGERGR